MLLVELVDVHATEGLETVWLGKNKKAKIANCATSMPRCIKAVLEFKGAMTQYCGHVSFVHARDWRLCRC